MNYYKVIKDGEIIDANYVFLKWQRKNNILVACDIIDSQFIQSSDGENVWRVDWLNRLPDDFPDSYESIDIIEIEEEEYNELKEKLSIGETVEYILEDEVPIDTVDVEIIEEEPQEEVMTATAMRLRIKALEEIVATLIEQNKAIVEQKVAPSN